MKARRWNKISAQVPRQHYAMDSTNISAFLITNNVHYSRILIIKLTYLLTPWCRVLLEKLTGLQLVKKFPAFHGTRRFITALTSVRQLSVSWASRIQSIYPHPTSWRSILILSTHLRLGLPSGLLPSGFPNKIPYTPYPHPYAIKSLRLYDENLKGKDHLIDVCEDELILSK